MATRGRTVDGTGHHSRAAASRLGPTLTLTVPVLAPEVVAAYRPRVAALSRRIADRICHDVAGFSEPAHADVVERAIAAAVGLFVDTLAGVPTRSHLVAAHYRGLGRAEARAGHDLDAMRAAHQVATQLAWDEVCTVAADLRLSATDVAALCTALLELQRHLHDQALAGCALEREHRRTPPADERGRLLAAWIGGGSAPAPRLLAGASGVLPPRLAVVATSGSSIPASLVTDSAALACVVRDRVVVVAEPDDVERVARALAQATSVPVAVSWDVRLDDVPHAARWAARALWLARSGRVRVPADRIVRCVDLRAELWLHADPALRRHVSAHVLAPLAAEKRSQRRVLGETLLLWLQTRASAPVMAERLGVHDQTVRHRLRRLKQLFGDALDDPRRASEILQALQAERAPADG